MKVLFVCASNVCRSPYAEFWFKRLVAEVPQLAKNIEWVKSGAVLNRCSRIHSRARAALLADGFTAAEIDSHHPTHQKDEPSRFAQADLIIGMTKVQKLFLGKKLRTKYITLSEAATGKYSPIPDPWLIKDQIKYNREMSVILDHLKKLVEKMKAEGRQTCT